MIEVQNEETVPEPLVGPEAVIPQRLEAYANLGASLDSHLRSWLKTTASTASTAGKTSTVCVTSADPQPTGHTSKTRWRQ